MNHSMINILHITKNNECINYINIIVDAINSVDKQVSKSKINLENKIVEYPYYISKDIANEIWKVEGEYYKKFDVVIVSDIAMIGMPLIYNMTNHNIKVIFYLFNRIDWGCWNISNDEHNNYINTLRKEGIYYKDRITYLFNNKYDCKMYNELDLIYDKEREKNKGKEKNKGNIDDSGMNNYIPNTPLIIKKMYIHEWDKLIVFGIGTCIDNYYTYLNKITYDFYGERSYDIFNNIDKLNIYNYMGILLLPYQTTNHSLFNNLGRGILYFIPSKSFIYELYDNKWYYWEGKKEKLDNTGDDIYNKFKKDNIELSEFYQHPELFVYFDSWEDLYNKFEYYKDSYNYNTKVAEINKYIIKINNSSLNYWYKLITNK